MSTAANAVATRAGQRQARIVSQAEWLEARKALLAKEKEWTHLKDALSAERQQLPWVRVEKNYLFETASGKRTLSDLFEGRSQLIIYHFMFGPEWAEGCPGCSIVGDHLDGSVAHVNARDITLMAVSRAPLGKIQAFQKRMGWRFPWASSFGSDFNFDYNVSFTPEQVANGKAEYNYGQQPFPTDEAPGASVFYKHTDGSIYHTYSSYGRGLEQVMGVYNWIDIAPKGRNEAGLTPPMAWVRHHDKYGDPNAASKIAAPTIEAKKGSCCSEQKS